MAVDKSSQSGGAGTKLLEGLIERVQVAGFSALSLSCREKVLPFYESFARNHEAKLSKEEKGTYFNGDKKFELHYTFSKE